MAKIIKFGSRHSTEKVEPHYIDSLVSVRLNREDHLTEYLDDIKNFVLLGESDDSEEKLFIAKGSTDLLISSIKQTLVALQSQAKNCMDKEVVKDQLTRVELQIEEVKLAYSKWE